MTCKMNAPLRLTTFLAAGLSLLSCSRQQPPNIIIIIADDLGYGDIGCYGNDHINTPFLDQLAGEGMRFTDFHANGAVCTPTRAALMTGKYQQRSDLEEVLFVQYELRRPGLSPDHYTISRAFKDIGYSTALFGKWHLGYEAEYNPVNHGFDEFRGFLSGNIDYISHRDGVNDHDWWHKTEPKALFLRGATVFLPLHGFPG